MWTATQRSAIGDLRDLPADVRRALESKSYRPMPAPRAGDWLTAHPESGQTYDDFVASRPHVPSDPRRVLTLLPFGDFQSAVTPETLRDYAAAFFALTARTLPVVSVDEVHATTRINPQTQRRQIRTGDVLAYLRARLPADAFSSCAFTLEDLYPDPSWNFVFGQASLHDRVGVFSFARYDPTFFGEPRTTTSDVKLVRRALNVMAHETGHMFGLSHCVYFACLMNGSNHLEETDRRPMHPCPVCLKKLWWSIRFDVAARFRALEAFYARVRFDDEAAWAHARLAETTS